MRVMGRDKKNDISVKLHESEQALPVSDESEQALSISDEPEQALPVSDESEQALSISDEPEQMLPDPDENLTDEEYFKKYLAGKNTEELVREQETFTAAVQKELQQATNREIQRLQENPEIAGQEPAPELLDRILVGMEVIREREGTETCRGESTEFRRESCSAQELLKEEGKTAGKMPEPDKQEAYHPEVYLTEEDRRALEIGRRHLHGSKRRRLRCGFGAAAAVLACILVAGVSSEANRERLVNAFYVLVGQESRTKVNNEDDYNESSAKEWEARAKIKEQTGIEPVQFLYLTKELQYSGYEITSTFARAELFYQYQDTIFTVLMEKEEQGVVKGDIYDGKVLESYSVSTRIGEVQVLELEADLEYKYVTKFVYENTYYKIYGALPREEFVKIVESLFF